MRLSLAAGSALATLALLAGGLKLYAWRLGIRDPSFLPENRLPIFLPDRELGYRTAPNFTGYCFGTIKLQTNERGFRGASPVRAEKPPGVRRLLGFGDSVMWGIGVNEAETFLAKLGQKLNQTGRWEVLNAGVIGYSAWQEAGLLERDLLSLRPDIVIVNYCANDLVPSEDPFNRMPALYLEQLQALREGRAELPASADRAALEPLMEVFQARQVGARFAAAPPRVRELAWELWVAQPMRRMARATRDAGGRLIYLFIPPDKRFDWDEARIRRWKNVLTEAGAEWLDVTELVSVPDAVPPLQRQAPAAKPFWRSETLDSILVQRHIEQVQQRNMYIDLWHLSRRGHDAVAEQLYLFLSGQPLAKGVDAHRRTGANAAGETLSAP